jgi:two-component system, OmpR family, sensor histidine kinase MprB
MSLRWRWALSIGLVAFVAVVATAAAALLSTNVLLRSQVDQDLRARFELASRAVPAVPLRGPFERTDRDPFEVQPDEGFDTRHLVALDAVIQVTIGRALVVPGDPPLPLRRYAALDDGPIIETVFVDGVAYRMISGQVQGPRLAHAERVVQVAMPIDGVRDAVRQLFGRLTRIGVLLALLAGGFGWLLARSAAHPIEQLTRATDSVTDLDAPDMDFPTGAPGEVGRLATSFERMMTSLRTSREQQRRLIADAGHEFRTPLTALRTNLDTLRRRADDLTPEQREQLLDAAISETRELSELAAELVDLATDVSLQDLPMEPLDLRDVAAAVVARFRSRTTIPLVFTGEGAMVVGRQSDLERAISNLVDNAVKWSPPDQPIEVAVDGRTVTVRDRGPGIPEVDLPHVFDRFHRAITARTTPGAGLGLAIVEHIVSAHEGSVFARNRAGGGAEVGFTLP